MKNFSSSLWRNLLSLALLACLALPGAAQTAPEPKLTAAQLESVGPLLLRDESIEQVLALLERWTGKTVLRPQALPAGTISLTLKGSVSREEAIRALETLLTLNGIAITPLDDKFLKVTALALARSEAPELIDGSTLALPPSGRIASKIFQLNFLRVAEFMPQIASLLNPGTGSPPVLFDKANAALITDSLSNLQRIETLVAKLDQPLLAGLSPKFYQLHFAKASDVVNKMRSILSGALQNQVGTATTYNPDDRTNQIVLVSDPRQHPFFDDLVARLDVKSDPNTRNEVIYLKHAASKDVASILSQLVSGQNSAAKSGSGADAGRPGQIIAPLPPIITQGPNNTTISTPAPITLAGAVNLGLGESTNQFSALMTILPEERSNSLVISGTVDDIRLIRDLVDKIDIILAQVRIEVIIAEVTLKDTDKSGITALNLTAATDPVSGRRGITNFSGAVAGWVVTDGVVNPLAFKAAMGDAGSKSNVRILSAPLIMTTHNKEATLTVGQSQPIITGSQASPVGSTTGTGFATSSQVTYKDIAIELKVTPLIGDDGNIQLKIDQKVDDIIGTVTVDNNQQPIIGRRQANSFINVQDGQMVVLGGLQRTKGSAGRTKLGFLFELPIISQLFGGRQKDAERTELLLFIRPHVIRPHEGGADTAKKIDELSNKDQVNEYLNPPPPKKKK